MEQTTEIFKTCLTHKGFPVLYQKRLATKSDICINPVHGEYWTYSTKDPDSGIENVIVATTDPDLIETHPELGTNEMFNAVYK